MRVQDYIVAETKSAAEEIWKYAKAVGDDKVAWSPLDAGRSVLDIARECAQCPIWGVMLITTRSMPEFTEESQAAMKAEMDKLTTVDQCVDLCNENLAKLYEVVANLTDEQLKEEMFLPFSGGRNYTISEIAEYPHWNFDYHQGQIAYIQTLYGDKEMY